jgi:succinate dehydrogenase/fumarate reductase-like Fe-S protein
MGDGSGTASCGIRINGRLVLADTTSIGSVIKSDGRLKIEPLSGYPVIRDLMVDYSKFEENRIKAKPWMQSILVRESTC